VPLFAGFEDEVSLLRVHDLIAELRSHASLKDVAVLVLVCVTVKILGGLLPRSVETINRTASDLRLLRAFKIAYSA
jgi:hypothetical protein